MQKIRQFFISYWPLLLILSICSFFFLTSIGHSIFWDWDECIYSEYAKEMHQTGNILTNYWNGIKGLEKPPLYALLLQIPFSFGFNEFNGRLLSVIFSLGIISSVYIFSKKYFSQNVAILSSLLLIAGKAFIIYSFRVNTDLAYTFFIFGCIFTWIISLKKGRYAFLSGVFLALAVYVKGLSVISFLFVIFLSIFLPYRKEKFLNFIKLILTFLVIILPWHLYQLVVNNERFIYVYFYENLIKRANNPIEFHFTSRLFYAKQILKEFFPFIAGFLVIPMYVLLKGKKWMKLTFIKKEIEKRELLIFLLLLVCIPLVILTKAQTRLQWYLIPLYPFIAILIGYFLDVTYSLFQKKYLMYIIILLVAIAAFRSIYAESVSTRLSSPQDSARVEVLKKASAQPDKSITYLVPFSERRAKDVLSPNLTTTTTFTYGGNTCAPYYSNKRILFFYSTDDFKKQLTHGLFIIENGDAWIMKDIPAQILLKNSDYTLFKI